MMPCARVLGAAAAIALSAALAAPPLAAQEGVPPDPPPGARELVRVAEPVKATAARGATVEVSVPFTVLAGWHVNAHRPNEDFLVPTVLALQAAPGVRVGAPRYPDAKQVTLSFSETPLAVYEENAAIVVPLTVEAGAAEGERALTGTLRFQACDDQVCLPPMSVPLRIVLSVAGGGAPTDSAPPTVILVPEPAAAAIGAGDSLTGLPDSAGFATGPPGAAPAWPPPASGAAPAARAATWSAVGSTSAARCSPSSSSSSWAWRSTSRPASTR